MARRKMKLPKVLEGRERLSAAINAWERLSKQRQKTLVDETIETRNDELCSAYTGVVAVSRGFKRRGKTQRIAMTRKKRGAKKSAPQSIVCIVFRVKKKGDSKTKSRKNFQPVPKHLFAFETVNRQRRLCAIPTDLDCQSDYAPSKIVAQALPEKIGVSSTRTRRPVSGVLTCVVQHPVASGPLAMSCYHVLGMSARFGGTNAPNDCKVFRFGSNRVVATLDRRLRGHLSTSGISFDSALAGIVSPQDLRAAIGNSNPVDFLANLNFLPDLYNIHTPTGVLRAQVARVHVANLPINYGPRVGNCVNRVVVEADVLGVGFTKGGDSGSPVRNLRGNVLLGMHIAGVGKKAYMFPAIDILRLRNYGVRHRIEMLELVRL